jgi:hypothetical protein
VVLSGGGGGGGGIGDVGLRVVAVASWVAGRGYHSSFQINVSTFCGMSHS